MIVRDVCFLSVFFIGSKGKTQKYQSLPECNLVRLLMVFFVYNSLLSFYCFTFYHGKSPLNHPLVDIFRIFFQPLYKEITVYILNICFVTTAMHLFNLDWVQGGPKNPATNGVTWGPL